MYSYQGMPNHPVTTQAEDWLADVRLLDRVVLTTPDGLTIVGIQTDYDSEFGNNAWVYRFELELEDGEKVKLCKDCLCMGASPERDLARGFRHSWSVAHRKLTARENA